MAVSDETKLHDSLLLHLAEPRSEDARVAERYQQQLGLPLSTLARLLGPTVVRSVALIGSDTLFPTGTDVAVLFETPQPAVLENLLYMRVSLAVKDGPGVKTEQGEAAGLAYRGFRSPDRRVSSFLAKLDKGVVVTNSLHQIERLGEVRGGKAKSIAELPEFAFFRDRYPLGDAEESALLFLSDATIRRWCGPRWRIADSRRVRTAAVMAEIQTGQVDRLVKKEVQPGPIYTDLPLAGAGQLTLTPGGVVSSTAGSMEFLTPISEIPLEEVTKTEADAYVRWRDGYQRNWSVAFDPIAVRIGVHKDRLTGDMTVMPLIVASEYRELMSISRGGKFAPDAGDPHGAMLHTIVALNPKSRWFGDTEKTLPDSSRGFAGLARRLGLGLRRGRSLLGRFGQGQARRYFSVPLRNLGRLPVALRVETSSSLRLAVFLTGFRTYVEETAPGLTQWESLKYRDQSYVRVSPTEKGGREVQDLSNIAVYYVTSPEVMTVTLNEDILKRTIDRQLARQKAEGEKKPAGARPSRRHQVKLPNRPAQPALRLWPGRGHRPLAGHQRRAPGPKPVPDRCQSPHARRARADDATPRLGQHPDPQRVEAAVPRPRPRGRPSPALAGDSGLSGRGQVRLEREVADDGIDRLRPPRRAETRPSRPAGAEHFPRRQLWANLRGARAPCPGRASPCGRGQEVGRRVRSRS